MVITGNFAFKLPDFQFHMYAVAYYMHTYVNVLPYVWGRKIFSAGFLLFVFDFFRFLTILGNHPMQTLLHQMNFYWADQGIECQPGYDVLGGYCIIWFLDKFNFMAAEKLWYTWFSPSIMCTRIMTSGISYLPKWSCTTSCVASLVFIKNYDGGLWVMLLSAYWATWQPTLYSSLL